MSIEDATNLDDLRRAQAEAQKEIIDQEGERPITSEDTITEKPKFFVSEEGGEQTIDIEKAFEERKAKQMAENAQISKLETEIGTKINETTDKTKGTLQVNDNTNKELFVTEQKPEKKPWWKFF